MQYSFSCPIEGCGQKMTVEAVSRAEAAERLTQMAKEHLEAVHPELQKTELEVRGDIDSLMSENSEETTS